MESVFLPIVGFYHFFTHMHSQPATGLHWLAENAMKTPNDSRREINFHRKKGHGKFLRPTWKVSASEVALKITLLFPTWRCALLAFDSEIENIIKLHVRACVCVAGSKSFP